MPQYQITYRRTRKSRRGEREKKEGEEGEGECEGGVGKVPSMKSEGSDEDEDEFTTSEALEPSTKFCEICTCELRYVSEWEGSNDGGGRVRGSTWFETVISAEEATSILPLTFDGKVNTAAI